MAAPAQAQATCNGLAVTIPGTPGSDIINGTPGADVIAAGAGNDNVSGLGGNDTICPGPGNDSINGGPGNDTVVAEPGPDGADQFSGGPDTDTARYFNRTVPLTISLDGVANDGATGEGDNNRADVENVGGGLADDRIVGSGSANALNGGGGPGNDTLLGGLGNDSLRGGSGNDTIAGQAGDDFGFGDTGNDTFVAAAAEDDGADFFEGASGIDTADYGARFLTVSVNLDGLANDGTAGEQDNVRLDVENVIGGAANDTIVARNFQSNPNSLFGGQGNDLLDSRDAPFISNDRVDGGLLGVDLCLTDPDDTRVTCEL